MNKAIKVLNNIPIKVLIGINIVYLMILVIMSGGNINPIAEKNFIFVTMIDPTYFSGEDVFYGLRSIRVVLKACAFIPVGIIFTLSQGKKDTWVSIKRGVFFILNLMTLIIMQIVLLDTITINIINYIIYLLTYIIASYIFSYIIKMLNN